MSTAARLESYGLFSPELVGRVDETAQIQRGMGWREYLAHQNVEPPETIVGPNGLPFTVLDIKPVTDYDETRARILFVGMANPIDPNIAYYGATTAAVDPNSRLIVVGNPSGPGYPGNAMTRSERKLLRTGDASPTARPVLHHLRNQGVSTLDIIGGSWGVNRANAAAQCGMEYDIHVPRLVHIEAPDPVARTMTQLGAAFKGSETALQGYVNATEVPAYLEARQESIGGNAYIIGLLRLSNLAITRCLTKGGYEVNTQRALDRQDSAVLTSIWGGDSELAIDDSMQEAIARLSDRFGLDRVHSVRLPGERHAMFGDIHLVTALTYLGLGLGRE